MTETLEQRLMRHEGIRLRPYHDSKGLLTTGIGRCLDTHPLSPVEIKYVGHDGCTKPITIDQAAWLLRRDIADCRMTVAHAFTWAESMTPLRQEVLIEMVFQMGLSKVQKFKHALAAMQNGTYDRAADEMLDSDWHREDSPARAEELAAYMRNGSL